MTTTGRIHSHQSLGTLDGPGLRYVLFLQGCPLRCGYCHNPDAWDPAGGAEATVEAVMDRVRRYKPYFGTEGGLTVSGGEALLQPAFVGELFARCRAEGIHTCLDTSGYRLDGAVEALLAVTDLALLDVKMTTEADYQAHVGCSLSQVLRFWDRLEELGIPCWIRQVIVEGFNDTEENLLALAGLIRAHGNVERVELLPFRKLCVEKYQKLGVPFPFDGYPETAQETTDRLMERLRALCPDKAI